MTEQDLYEYLAGICGPGCEVTRGVSTTRALTGKDLYGSYHFTRFYYPGGLRNTLRRLQTFGAPADMAGWTVYEFGSCLGALTLECARRGARVRGWEYHPDKVRACRRLAAFLRVSAEQAQFFQQDIRTWLASPAARAKFERQFPAADLTICCAVDAYIPRHLRLELYRLLVRTSRHLCWFESNCGQTAAQLVPQLKRAGFPRVSHVGGSRHRQVFVCHTRGCRIDEEPVGVDPVKHLTSQQCAGLRSYIATFLSKPEHGRCFDPDPTALFHSLVDPNRLSLALMPVDKHMGRARNDSAVSRWYFRYVKKYARFHKRFLNELEPSLKIRLYAAKLLEHSREKKLRHFLSLLSRCPRTDAERAFFHGLRFDRPLLEQGVSLVDCMDFSSGRAYDEGSIVNKIVLERRPGSVAFFLKGLGKVRRQKIARQGPALFEQFEVTAFAAAALVGLSSVQARSYRDSADPAMVGYALLQEIPGVNTNALFRRLSSDRFRIRAEFARFQGRLIREFAAIAAFSDVLGKGDRKIVQPVHPEYEANCLVDFDILENHPRRQALSALDFNHLFQPDNGGVLQDISDGRCCEIGIVTAFEGFYNGQRAALLGAFGNAYLRQWKRIKAARKALTTLIAAQHGKHSFEYRVFQRAIACDPGRQFEIQKAALLQATRRDEDNTGQKPQGRAPFPRRRRPGSGSTANCPLNRIAHAKQHPALLHS